ncbi:MAG: DUF6503 family protein [Acidobacteriota bacterium]
MPWLILALLALPAPPSEASGRPEIVDRAIQFHGGERYTASETRFNLCSKSGCFEVLAKMDGGSFLYDVAGKVRDGQRRVRVTNDTVELWSQGTPTAIPPERRQALADWAMARVYFVFLPYRLGDPSARIQDLGEERWGGRELHRIKVTFEPGSSTDADDEFLYWFDPETARLEQFAYSYAGNPGGLRFRRLINYRRVGGILFFDQENLGTEGHGLSVDSLSEETVKDLRSISTVRVNGLRVSPSLP